MYNIMSEVMSSRLLKVHMAVESCQGAWIQSRQRQRCVEGAGLHETCERAQPVPTIEPGLSQLHFRCPEWCDAVGLRKQCCSSSCAAPDGGATRRLFTTHACSLAFLSKGAFYQKGIARTRVSPEAPFDPPPSQSASPRLTSASLRCTAHLRDPSFSRSRSSALPNAVLRCKQRRNPADGAIRPRRFLSSHNDRDWQPQQSPCLLSATLQNDRRLAAASPLIYHRASQLLCLAWQRHASMTCQSLLCH